MRNYSNLISNFEQYVWNFYNKKNGVCPIATDKIIQLSVNRYLEKTPLREIDFDSIDRKRVGVIIEKFNYLRKELKVKL